MSIKRTIITTVVALALVAVVAPVNVSAVTIDELLAQIAQLQAQLLALQGGGTTVPTGTGACAGITFTRNLTIGATGSDVKCLQTLLNGSASTQVSITGAGSPGSETSYFGAKTLAAVKIYQAQKGFIPANQVGPLTRAALNADLSSGGGGTTPPPVTPPTTGGLSVSVAYDTPAAASIATGASGKFTKLNLTAGSGAVSITRLYVTRTGLSANADVLNVKVVDTETGGYVGNIGSLNSDNKAIISFYPALTINAGQTRSFYLQASILSTASAGRTAVLGIASASDIVSNATSVSGTFPANGNAMSVVALTVGTVTVSEDGTVTDASPNAGDTDVVLDQFKIAVSSTESVTVETITAKRVGSAAPADTANIELYDVTNNRTLGTVASWDAYDNAVFSNLNLTIEKGKTVRYKILIDVIGGAGSSKTVNADIIDGTDVLVSVKGNSYGYYIAPSIGSSFSGKGNSNQTIQNGSLVISKSASTPATGKIAAGDGVTLAKFDFDAKGEEIKITKLGVTITNATGGWSDSDITSVSVYDANGSLVLGPKDPSALVVSFTDTFIVPVGVHTYTVKANLADSVANNDTVLIKITNPNSASNVTATGQSSNDTISPTPASDVSANTLTISGAALTVTTLGSPAAKSVPLGTADYVWATFSLDAGSAGENIQVTSIKTTDSLGGSAAAADIDNAEIWADLTTANSDRGDAYETKVSSTIQQDATTEVFTMVPTLVITKGTFVKLALVADLNTGGGSGNHTFALLTGSGVVANGASTGTALVDDTSITYVSTAKQTMGTTTSGTLTVSVGASTPTSDIVLGNTNGVSLGVFRLAASNVEDLDLDQINFVTTNGAFASTLYFYNGTTLLGSVPGATSGSVIFNDGTLTIPANSNKDITVKADIYAVDGTTISNDDALRVGLQGTSNVQTTGKLSGQTANSSVSALGNAMVVLASRPYFAKNASSPSGNLIPGADQVIAIFDVTANAAEDITFDDADSDQIKVSISATINDTTQSQMSFYLKDSDGNTLDGTTQAAATNSTKAMATSVTFTFGTNDFVIPKGTTKQLYVYADLSDFEDSGDNIRAWLDDAADANCTFGINYAAISGGEGTYVFKNDITANTLSRVTGS